MPVNSRGQRVKTNRKSQKVSDTEARLRNPKKRKPTWGGGAAGIGGGTAGGG